MAVGVRPHSVVSNMGYARVLFYSKGEKEHAIKYLKDFLRKPETDWKNELPRPETRKVVGTPTVKWHRKTGHLVRLIKGNKRGEGMRRKRRVYTDEFKLEAVKFVVEEGLTKAETARRLGVGQDTLGKWVKGYLKSREEPENSGLSEKEEKELKRLRKEIRELKMEREILKKAAVFFAKETK